MLKVTITKPGKKIVFNGQVLTTPCKVFIFEKDQTAMKVILMQAGIKDILANPMAAKALAGGGIGEQSTSHIHLHFLTTGSGPHTPRQATLDRGPLPV